MSDAPAIAMSTDELNARMAAKTARFEKHVEAVETAYVEHEDFIADFDSLIEVLTMSKPVSGQTLAGARSLRDRAYELLLGPLPQDDPRDQPYDLRGGPTT